jgi:hypothetical protein
MEGGETKSSVEDGRAGLGKADAKGKLGLIRLILLALGIS